MGPPEMIIVGIVAIAVLFGFKKIPEIARSLGRSQGEFKKGMKEGQVLDAEATTPEKKAEASTEQPPAAAPTPAPDTKAEPPSG